MPFVLIYYNANYIISRNKIIVDYDYKEGIVPNLKVSFGSSSSLFWLFLKCLYNGGAADVTLKEGRPWF